jgi:penicillin-binding protein 1C
MWQVSGVDGAAPVWRAAMDYLRKVKRPGALPVFTAHAQKFASPGFGRILYPENGMVIALDPDIPPARQRVPLEADRAGSFRADGETLSGDSWQPVRGTHVISLRSPDGRELDAVHVEVR